MRAVLRMCIVPTILLTHTQESHRLEREKLETHTLELDSYKERQSYVVHRLGYDLRWIDKN